MTLLLLALLSADASAPSRAFDAAGCGLLRTIAPLAGEIRGAAFTRDGRRLVVGCERAVRVYDTAAWAEVRRLEDHPQALVSLALHPSGRKAAGGGLEGEVVIWDLESGSLERRIQGHTSSVSALAFSPDGALLLSGSHDASLRLWSWADGTEAARLPWAAGPVLAAAISPDGRRFAAAGSDGSIRIWNAATREEEKTLKMEGCAALAFARDGRRLLAAGKTGAIVGDLADGSARDLPDTEAPLTAAAFFADDRHVAVTSGDHAVRLLDSRTGAVAAVLRHHIAPVAGVALHPDGRTFVTLGRERHLKVWGPAPGGMANVRPRGYLGIHIQEGAVEVTVTSVSAGTAAASAGIVAGDSIRRVGGAEIRTMNDCVDKISSFGEGEEVEFEIGRQGAVRTERIRLGRRPEAR